MDPTLDQIIHTDTLIKKSLLNSNVFPSNKIQMTYASKILNMGPDNIPNPDQTTYALDELKIDDKKVINSIESAKNLKPSWIEKVVLESSKPKGIVTKTLDFE